jgi:hypothetical protein
MIKAGITTMLSALVLQTGVFAQIYVKNPGNVGIGMQNPDRKLQVDGHTEIGDAHDLTRYGILQLTRPAVQPDDKYHLSFIRAGQVVTGFGYVPNTNNFGLWVSSLTNTASPTMSFTQPGNVGVGVTNPDFKLQVGGFTEISDNQGVHDPTRYGVLQLTRPANQGDEKFHLSFIRGGNAICGMGFANNSNNFGIWAYPAKGTNSDPVIGITPDLFVGIGTSAPTCKLHVAGDARANAFIAPSHTYADYVFNSDYELPSLRDVKAYIQQNHHLPEVPTEEEVKKTGINLGEQSVILLKKVEELTLYVIDQNEKLQVLMEENKKQQAEIENLKKKKGRR